MIQPVKSLTIEEQIREPGDGIVTLYRTRGPTTGLHIVTVSGARALVYLSRKNLVLLRRALQRVERGQ